MPKLIIFDLDGTLLDTIEDLANSTNYALRQHGFPEHSIETIRQFVGNGINKLLERALPENKRSSDFVSMLKIDFIKFYSAHTDEFTRPYPGISDLLTRLYNEGYQMAIASNKMHDATVRLIRRFFPNIEFTDIRGQQEGFPTKPNPAIVEEILKLAKVEKSKILYVGDSAIDVATAYNAKIAFTGVLWGFRPQKEMEEIGATSFAKTTEELYKIIKR